MEGFVAMSDVTEFAFWKYLFDCSVQSRTKGDAAKKRPMRIGNHRVQETFRIRWGRYGD